MKPDFIKITLTILTAMTLGWTLNKTAEFGLFAAFICNIWLLFRAKRLHNWFTKVKELPHAEKGVFYLLHRDIKAMRSKHQAKKRELQHNLKRVREASTELPDAIVITNKSGEITWSNRLAEELLNIQQPRDLGHRVSNLLRNPNFVQAYANHQKKPVDIDIEAPSDQHISINIKVIDLAENMQMIVARNISRHIENTRAQKDFVSNVSHELKTPLTVMRGYLEMIDDDPQSKPKFEKPIKNMLLQTERMQSTIDDLLYLAKLQNSHQATDFPEEHISIDIKKILEIIMDSAHLLAEQNKQIVTIEVNDQLSIMGNASELQIAFNNLIINAIRYTPKEGEIHIKWHHREKSVVFSVTDNGIGIAPNHISRLTERFYRVDQGRSRNKGGSGLGLAIVKNILEKHQAELKISSSLGNGSCFECIFPRDI